MLVPKGRSALGWLRERDIDLLLCLHLHSSIAFQKFISEKVTNGNGSFQNAWVSVSDQFGEVDLLIELSVDDTPMFAMVENKIAAAFQPSQPQRYLQRKASLTDQGTLAATVLIAPRSYTRMGAADLFDARIAYEDFRDFLLHENSAAGCFIANAIDDAIAAQLAGYTAVPDQRVSDVWQSVYELASSEFPDLRMTAQTSRPSSSVWIYFRKPHQFFDSGLRSVSLVLKGERGQADLQFSSTSTSELQEICDRNGISTRDQLRVVPASKSASIRIETPKIDFLSEAPQTDAILAGLRACEQLRTLFVEQRTCFLQLSVFSQSKPE